MPDLSLWLCFARTRTKSTAKPFMVYEQFGNVAGPLPAGVGLWSSRCACKRANKFLADHPGRELPADIRPVAYTGEGGRDAAT